MDEKWVDGAQVGYQLEIVLPPVKGYPTAATGNADVVEFCESMNSWTKRLDKFCKNMIEDGKATTGGSGVRVLTMKDIHNHNVVIETAVDNGKVKLDCTPQFTISLPPHRLWCFIKASFHPNFAIYFNEQLHGQGVDLRLAQIDALAISSAAKLLLFFVGTLIRTGRSQVAPQAYLKTYAGTILTRSNLANVYEHGLTDTDKQFFSQPATSLAHQIVTIFAPVGYSGNNTNVPMFPHGWMSNTTPGEPIHLYLQNLARGLDDLQAFYPKDVESLGAMAYHARGDDWVVEYRNPVRVIGTSGMGVLRTAWIRLFEQAHHFQHASMAGACPQFTFGPNAVLAKIAATTMSPAGTHWGECVGGETFKSCR